MKVTGAPNVAGFGIEVRVVEVGVLLTICDAAGLVLAAKLESPEYVAVIECVPTESAFVKKVAIPFSVVPVPINLPAS